MRPWMADMSGKLLMMSHGDSPDAFEPYVALSEPIHAEYADRCGADFQLFRGTFGGTHPAWNRIRMALDAFEEGYEKVVWFDCDVLVVDLDRSIFAATDDTTPLHMVRCNGFPWPQDARPIWEAWNDGVLVMNRSVETIEVLEHVWAARNEPPKPWHIPSLWELSSLLDCCKADESLVTELDVRFNLMMFSENLGIVNEAVIRAWHGYPLDERWRAFRECYREVYE